MKANIKGKEFIIWGIAPGECCEQILSTAATTEKQADLFIRILSKEFNCKSIRVQIIDLSEDYSWEAGKLINI